MSAPIIDLADAAAERVAEVGGKARQLSQLLAFGLKVPSGFVVRVSALAGDIDDRLRAAIADELTRRDWHTRALAVRSSAPQEDSAATSFAGIFRSELHVVGVEAVLAAIGRVRASAQAPAANAYRARHGLPDAGMAVMIMPMLPAVAAGVAFTCDPRSGRDDRIVIHAVSGLADALVGGQAIGEEIVIAEDRLDESLRFCTPRRNDGGRAPLPDEAALALGHVLRDAAQALDYAAPYYDLEWVFDGADCWLVQARPVTARPWHTYPGLAGQEAVWSNGNTRDVVPHVMGAMDWLGWRRMADLLLEQGYLLAGFPLLDGARRSALIGGRLYLNAYLIQWEG
jgi:pyruvate,water dikinase